MIVAWWSAGVTSAVACKMAIDKYGSDNVDLVYFHIASAHPDNKRFMSDCEKWYGKTIRTVSNDKYDDQFDVIESTRFINGPYGAKCTGELKKNVRLKVQRDNDYEAQVFGFEYSRKEINRALRFADQHPETNPQFLLIDARLTKQDCVNVIAAQGITIPKMYELGYPNNNCVGCVKGGMGYWNKIRDDFPDVFIRMAITERDVGASCINGVYLDELDPSRGRTSKIYMPDCGSMCEIKYAEIDHPRLVSYFEDYLTGLYFWLGEPMSVMGRVYTWESLTVELPA